MGIVEVLPGVGGVEVDCLEDIRWFNFTGKQLPDLFHGNSGVMMNGDKGFAGSLQSIGPGFADEMPHRIFNILRIVGLVQFKLFNAFLVLTGIVERYPTLPVARSHPGIQFNNPVKCLNGFDESTRDKMLNALLLIFTGGKFGFLSMTDYREYAEAHKIQESKEGWAASPRASLTIRHSSQSSPIPSNIHFVTGTSSMPPVILLALAPFGALGHGVSPGAQL